MAELLIVRQRRERNATVVSSSTQANLGDEIRLVADISPADLQDSRQRWRMDVWRSTDGGTTWRFLCGQIDEGRPGRTEASRLTHVGGDLNRQLMQMRVTTLDRALDLGGLMDVSATATQR